MRAKIATAAVAGALAVAGTAVAAGGGPFGGPLGGDRQEQLAEDLAGELDGVNPNEVSEALQSVAEQKRAEHRAEIAAGIAAQLDGVDADAVEAALSKHSEQVQAVLEAGERPEMGSLATTLAEELGKSEDEISTALEAAREAGIEQRQAEMLERLEAAVESGEISEEQADEIRERIESGPPAGMHGGPGGHRPGPGEPGGFGPGGPPQGGPGTDGEGAAGTGFEVTPPAS